MAEGKKRYFESALSDFVFDVAAGGAIRHLADRGHTVEQIMNELDYPVPRAKVEKAVYRHLSETGILLPTLPCGQKEMQIRHIQGNGKDKPAKTLAECIKDNGEECSYMECPFGQWMKNGEEKLRQITECLTSREREYIFGIRWERNIMYHRLNRRMWEIGMKLAANTEEEWKFFFLQSQECIIYHHH